MNLEKEIFDIALEDIMPNRFQPREMFDEQALNELALSIKEHGVVQPITVRKVGDKYEIIAGERRFRASKLAGKKTVPALVKNYDDKEAAKVALIENLQRKDLTPIEEARTYQTILKLDNLTQEELANDLGKAQSTVANKLRLLNLDDTVQTALLNEKISERHARSLLNIEDKESQRRLLDKIIQDRLTVRQLDEIIAVETGKVIPQKQQFDDNNIEDNFISDEPIPMSNDIVLQDSSVLNDKKSEEQNEITPTPLNSNLENETIEQQSLNIFDRLRKPDITNQTNSEENPILDVEAPQVLDILKPQNQTENIDDENPYGDIYDLRFAINNFRQAIQNTKKFGFKVESDEFDFDNIYQIVIKIDKEKPEQKA